MHLAGGGIIAHPQGIAAGVSSMRSAWQAAVGGVSLEEYARHDTALAAAIAKFG
jgi:ribulose-bisphosphate carboxylase large chain